MRRVYNTDYMPKHKDVFIFYTLLIKYIGEEACTMKRNKLYQIVSDHFYIAPNFVTRIINKMVRNGYTPHRCEITEFKTRVGDFSKIVNID
jgi:hypothetical protein